MKYGTSEAVLYTIALALTSARCVLRGACSFELTFSTVSGLADAPVLVFLCKVLCSQNLKVGFFCEGILWVSGVVGNH